MKKLKYFDLKLKIVLGVVCDVNGGFYVVNVSVVYGFKFMYVS